MNLVINPYLFPNQIMTLTIIPCLFPGIQRKFGSKYNCQSCIVAGNSHSVYPHSSTGLSRSMRSASWICWVLRRCTIPFLWILFFKSRPYTRFKTYSLLIYRSPKILKLFQKQYFVVLFNKSVHTKVWRVHEKEACMVKMICELFCSRTCTLKVICSSY